MNVLAYGDQGWLVEPDDPDAVLGLAAALRDEPGVLEVVPAARTVLARVRTADRARVRERLDDLAAGPVMHTAPDREPVELAVRYDGDDLADTAAEVGLDVDGLVRAHTASEYVVAFCGFAPGFAYLRGLDPSLHVGRLDEPRTRVPAGAVGVAGEFTGVYPRASPGGWRLLGRTDAPLWDVDREPPALLSPGTRVWFVAQR